MSKGKEYLKSILLYFYVIYLYDDLNNFFLFKIFPKKLLKLFDILDKSKIVKLDDQLKKEKNDKYDLLVEKFFNYCLQKCKEEKLEFGMNAD